MKAPIFNETKRDIAVAVLICTAVYLITNIFG